MTSSAGRTVYLTGQIGLVPATSQMINGGIEQQTHQALKNMGAVLKEAGASYNNGINY